MYNNRDKLRPLALQNRLLSPAYGLNDFKSNVQVEVNKIRLCVCESNVSVYQSNIAIQNANTAVNNTYDLLNSGNLSINLSLPEDSPHVSGDFGAMALTVRNDTLGTLVDTNLDYAPMQVNSDGELYVIASGLVTVIPQVLGEQNNLSSSQVTSGIDEPSTFIDCQYVRSICIFGETSVASTISLYQSQDNINFYPTGLSYIATTAQLFYINLQNASSRYYGLSYGSIGTYSSTLTGK
jgi:hypothetical protein